MNLKDCLFILPEVEATIQQGKAVVAIETSLIKEEYNSQQALDFFTNIQQAIRIQGAIPALIALIDGKMKIGITQQELERLCRSYQYQSVTRQNLPIAIATKETAATTLACGMILASLAGISILCTPKVKGIQRTSAQGAAISADLRELAATPVGIVCAGMDSALDTVFTNQYLETIGVPVIGLGLHGNAPTESGYQDFGLNYLAQNPYETAKILKTKWQLGLHGGILIKNTCYPCAEKGKVACVNQIGECHRHSSSPSLCCSQSNTNYSLIELGYSNGILAARLAVEYASLSLHI